MMLSERESHDRAMEFAHQAFAARRAGDEGAVELFERSFRFEVAAARRVVWTTDEPTRSVLLRSAASLALHAGRKNTARDLAHLGLRGEPSEEVKHELEEVLGAANQGQIKLGDNSHFFFVKDGWLFADLGKFIHLYETAYAICHAAATDSGDSAARLRVPYKGGYSYKLLRDKIRHGAPGEKPEVGEILVASPGVFELKIHGATVRALQDVMEQFRLHHEHKQAKYDQVHLDFHRAGFLARDVDSTAHGPRANDAMVAACKDRMAEALHPLRVASFFREAENDVVAVKILLSLWRAMNDLHGFIDSRVLL